jgi:hypothetical protein
LRIVANDPPLGLPLQNFVRQKEQQTIEGIRGQETSENVEIHNTRTDLFG